MKRYQSYIRLCKGAIARNDVTLANHILDKLDRELARLDKELSLFERRL